MIWIVGYVMLLLAFLFGKLSGESNKCNPVSNHNFCYFKPGNSLLTWTLAQQVCELNNSTLPVTTSEKEKEALTEFLKSTGITSMVWTSGIHIPGNGWKWIRGSNFRQNDPEVNLSRWSASAQRLYNNSTYRCISVDGSTGTWTAIDCNTNNNFICQYNVGPNTTTASGIDPSKVTASTPKTSTTRVSGIGSSTAGTSGAKRSTTYASSIDPDRTTSSVGSSRRTALNADPSTTRAFEVDDAATTQNKSDFFRILSYLAIAIVIVAIFIVIAVVTTKKLSTRSMRSNKVSTFDAHKSSTREDPPLPTDGAPDVGSDTNPSTVYAEIPLATIPDANGFSNLSHICYAPLEFHSETPAYATPVKINKNTMLQNSKPTADLYAEISPPGPTKSDL